MFISTNQGSEMAPAMTANKIHGLCPARGAPVNQRLAITGGRHSTMATGPFARTPKPQAQADTDHHHKLRGVLRRANCPARNPTVVNSVSSVSIKTNRPDTRKPTHASIEIPPSHDAA